MLNLKQRNLKNLKITILFFILSIALIFSLVNIGIPLIIKISSFIISLKKSDKIEQPTEFLTPPLIFFSYESTNSGIISLSGKSFVEGKVKVFKDGSEVKTIETAKNEGFSLNINLFEGENSIYAISENKTGKASLPSSTLIINFDAQPPEFVISSPVDGAKFTGRSQKTIKVEGKTELGSQVYANGHLLIVNNNGLFSSPISLNDGENRLKIEVFDKAGNKTEKEITVFYSP